MFVCGMHVHMHVDACVCTRARRGPQLKLNVFSHHSSLYIWEQGLSLSLEPTVLASLASQIPRDPLSLPPKCWGERWAPTLSWPSLGFWGSEFQAWCLCGMPFP